MTTQSFNLIIAAYMTAVPEEGISSGALYAVTMAEIPNSLEQHNRVVSALSGTYAMRNGPLLNVSNHYVTLTEAGRRMRNDLLAIAADIAAGNFSKQ